MTLDRSFELHIGTERFRLVPREVLGQEPHTSDPIPFLAQQISSTAELGYTDIDRRREVAYAMDSFHEGLATRLRFNLERQFQIRYSKGADTSYPGFVFCGPKVRTLGAVIDTEPTKAIQRGNITYLAAGTKLYQITDTSTRTLDTTFGNAITDLIEFAGNIVVAFGASVAMQYRASDTIAGAFSTLTGFNANFLVVVNDQIWRAKTPNTLHATDVLTGTWADYTVGDSSLDITGSEVIDGGVLLVGKEDGVYAFDSQVTAIPVTPELRLQADAQVGKVHAVFNRDAYFSTRKGAVRIAPGEGLEMVGLDLLADPALPGTPAETRPAAMTTDGRFLYYLVDPSGTAGVYIWKRDLAGHWHNYLYRTDLGASAALLFSGGKLGSTSINAILFAYASGANWQLAYARFPSTADPRKDSAYEFDDDTVPEFRVLDYVASYPTIPKYADRIKVIADDLTSTRTIKVDAHADNETAAQIADVSRSPNAEQVLRQTIDHHRISLTFKLETASVTTTPALRAFHLTVVPLPPVVTLHTFHVWASSEQPTATGGRSKTAYGVLRDQLRKLRAERKSHAVVDEEGYEFTGYIEDVRERPLSRKAGPGFTPSKAFVVTVKEVER